jgi:hypothetical protein
MAAAATTLRATGCIFTISSPSIAQALTQGQDHGVTIAGLERLGRASGAPIGEISRRKS